MIIVMQRNASEEAIQAVEAKILAHGLQVHISRGTERTLIGAVGDERKLEPEMFDPMPGVEKSMHILKQYKMVAREWHEENTVIDVAGVPIWITSTPCSRKESSMRASINSVTTGSLQLAAASFRSFRPSTPLP